MINKTDEELMVLVAKTDEKAYNVLLRRFLPLATSYTHKVINNLSYEDEVIQDTFLRLWKYAKKYKKSNGSVKTWFYKILSNSCRTFLKSKKHHLNLDEAKHIEDINTNIEKTAIVKQENTFLRKKISSLNSREQQAIILNYFEDYSNKETADLMGISVKAVETLLVRARRKLKLFYEQTWKRRTVSTKNK